MKKIFIAIMILIAFSTIVNAAMNPDLKECMQRDYEIKASPNQETICIFLDNSNCTISDFNSGICGEEFMTEDYCVKEGLPVWDKDKCCEGTEAYLRPNHVGQTSCRDVSIYQKISDQFLYRPIFSTFVIVILIIAVFIGFWALKKRK